MKILNFGSCNIDYVYSLSHIVRAGETLASSRREVFPGGKGLNQSIALARAGVKVCHAGCIGSDGGILLTLLSENGVDISYIRQVSEANGHAIIQVSADGENSIFLYSGSNAMVTKEQIDDVLSHFGEGDLLLLQNEISNLAYLIQQAHKRKMRIVLNPSPINEAIFQIDFSLLSIIALNETEAQEISGTESVAESLAFFRSRYPALSVMLTLGKDGCVYQDQNSRLFHPVFKVTAVDSTAAGDTFTGYFVASIFRGESIQNAIKIASCAAAIAVSRPGAATSIPTMEEVTMHMNTMLVRKTEKKAEHLAEQVDTYITKNLTCASLSELAHKLGYSTVYTGTLVKNLTGSSFQSYLHSKRLSLAAELLKNSSMPIGEIISHVGYKNESYFRRLFQEEYGMNPLTYRKSTDKL